MNELYNLIPKNSLKICAVSSVLYKSLETFGKSLESIGEILKISIKHSSVYRQILQKIRNINDAIQILIHIITKIEIIYHSLISGHASPLIFPKSELLELINQINNNNPEKETILSKRFITDAYKLRLSSCIHNITDHSLTFTLLIPTPLKTLSHCKITEKFTGEYEKLSVIKCRNLTAITKPENLNCMKTMVGNENILLCRNKLCFYAYSDLSCRTINDTLFSFNGKNFSEPKLLTINHTLNRIIHGYHISNKDDLILPLEVSLKLNESLFIEGFESKLLRESNLQYGSYLIKSIETTNITDNSLIFPMNKILNYTHISVKTLTAKLNHLDHWTNNPKI